MLHFVFFGVKWGTRVLQLEHPRRRSPSRGWIVAGLRRGGAPACKRPLAHMAVPHLLDGMGWSEPSTTR